MRLSLKTIPTDALTPILDLLDGYALFRLVMCGDGSLNNTLGRAVERFDLEYKLTTRAPENWIWPRFELRHLELNVSNGLGCLLETDPDSIGSSHYLFCALSELFPRLEHLSWQNDMQKWTFDAMQMVTLLPNLTTLLLGHYPISSAAVDWLPGSLTRLQFRLAKEPTHEAPPREITRLPPNLESLEMDLEMSDSETPEIFPLLATLPLRELVLNFSMDRLASLDEIEMLPRTLTAFSLKGREFSEAHMRLLPTQLATLSLHMACTLDDKVFCWLPKQLTRLELEPTKDASYPGDPSFLPRTLTDLNTPLYFDSNNWKDLPPNFHAVYASFLPVPPEHFATLPPGLLTFSNENTMNIAQVMCLPSNLTSLTIELAETESDMWSVLSSKFRSLRHLSCSLTLEVFNGDPSVPIPTPSLGSLPLETLHLRIDWLTLLAGEGREMTLPESLRSLSIWLIPSSSSGLCIDLLHILNWISRLPNSLTSLQMHSMGFPVPPEILLHLPPRLLTLDISPLSHLKEDHLQLEKLPPNLTSLKLYPKVPMKEISAQALIQRLPRSLTSLVWPLNKVSSIKRDPSFYNHFQLAAMCKSRATSVVQN